MLLYAYVFALIVGGVLLAASMILGSKDADGDGNADGGGEKDFGKDFSKDLSKDIHAGNAEGFILFFLSLRFWTFFLAFFGLTGLVMRGLGLLPGDVPPLIAALAMGLVAGFGVQLVVRKLARSSHNSAAGAEDFVGKTAKVVVKIEPGDVGKVRLSLKGQMVDVLATTEDADAMQRDEEVLVVEMRDSKALVAKVNGRDG